ncbi:putative bifunctional diguanylate cyclase/phosphodiesterase [Salinarimonas rosea]|uniref:putative bifunctional diguanylate cyclase/phosphodiesterase n=1 Tax=Salinarimonas rosea TaxID=552063 RepID=UPI0004047B59|nr:bifunctional diguanylate cyclase/phosphodiesterase [Salinarimonas rosea]
MPAYALSPFSGEFRNPGTEAAFRTERLPETARQARLFLIASAIVNTIFLVSDWRFAGDPHFWVAVPARLATILASLACLAAVLRLQRSGRLEHAIVLWQVVVSIAVGLLVSARSDLALFVVVVLPTMFYLVVPNHFRTALATGAFASICMLVGFSVLGEGPPGVKTTGLGLALGLLMLNVALLLVVNRSNRLRRLEWAATQRERLANGELAHSREMFERMFRTVPIPLLVSERASGRVLALNDAGRCYLGHEAEEVWATPGLYANPDDRARFVAAVATQGRVEGFEARLCRPDGEVRDVLLAASAIDIDGREALLAAVVDITERKLAEGRVWRAANHDALTGLPNRAQFQARLEAIAARAASRSGRAGEAGAALLLLDLDGLKEVNDTLGHDAGDALLVEVARRLSAEVEADDVVARLGGDEFAVVLARADRTLAEATAARFLGAMRAPVLFRDRVLVGRISIGLALCPEHDTAPGELVKDADLALYAAKQAGRNRLVVYEPRLRDGFERRVTLLREVGEALGADAIEPHYQPKVSLETGRITGFEALARWRRADGSVVTPYGFAAAFEDPELAIAIGERMRARIAADLRGWMDAGLACGRIAVNFAPAEFRRPDLAPRVLAQLARAGVPSERIDVEVTESVFLGLGGEAVEATLRAFQEAGMRIALDDFGTGFASLTHLKRFPVDDIKIDRSFVRDLIEDPDDAAIASAVIELGRALEIAVTAEGVETHAQAAFLAARGCAQAQGWLFGRPMPAAAVPDFLRERARAAA